MLPSTWKVFLSNSVLLTGTLILSQNASSQIIPDRTLQNESSIVTPEANQIKTITGGARRGDNLFHSFEKFSILNNQIVYFNNASEIRNIFSRVTGSNISNINGLIKNNGTANLFLINPNGIIFGENASLDIGGSFIATTANAIQFGEQGSFSASVPVAPQILTINPSALLINQITTQPIINRSIAENIDGDVIGLEVPDGKSLLLIGGNVSLDGGNLLATSGRIELGGLASSGSIGLNFQGDNISLNFNSVEQKADVYLNNDALVNVLGNGRGSIGINAQNLYLNNESELQAGIDERNIWFFST